MLNNHDFIINQNYYNWGPLLSLKVIQILLRCQTENWVYLLVLLWNFNYCVRTGLQICFLLKSCRSQEEEAATSSSSKLVWESGSFTDAVIRGGMGSVRKMFHKDWNHRHSQECCSRGCVTTFKFIMFMVNTVEPSRVGFTLWLCGCANWKNQGTCPCCLLTSHELLLRLALTHIKPERPEWLTHFSVADN